MKWEVTELTEKVDRIKILADKGLNPPRMFYIPKYDESNIKEAMVWAADIHAKEPKQIFNIRTYQRAGDKESLQTKHYTDITFDKLPEILPEALNKFICMIDAETPDDGRVAGNIIISVEELRGRPDNIVIEYCEKKVRAMVRDADKHIAIPINQNLVGKLNNAVTESILNEVIKKVKMAKLFDVIVEWTYFCKPSGILGENIVWWEYRKY